MTHYVVWPSADPRFGIRAARPWIDAGYSVLIGLDSHDMCMERPDGKPALYELPKPWTGYYGENGINLLVTEAYRRGADLVTSAADDMLPPVQGAQVHAEMYFKRFPDGYGVMQCTGDRQGEVINGRCNAERICGSPTFGKAWHERAFGGHGGFPHGFHSYFADELLKEVAERLGLLYQEPALKLDHAHHTFGRATRKPWHVKAAENWHQDCHAFERAKAEEFKAYMGLFK